MEMDPFQTPSPVPRTGKKRIVKGVPVRPEEREKRVTVVPEVETLEVCHAQIPNLYQNIPSSIEELWDRFILIPRDRIPTTYRTGQKWRKTKRGPTDTDSLDAVLDDVRVRGRDIGILWRVTGRAAPEEKEPSQTVRWKGVQKKLPGFSGRTVTRIKPEDKWTGKERDPDYIINWFTMDDSLEFPPSHTSGKTVPLDGPEVCTWTTALVKSFRLVDEVLSKDKVVVIGCQLCQMRSPTTIYLYMLWRGMNRDDVNTFFEEFGGLPKDLLGDPRGLRKKMKDSDFQNTLWRFAARFFTLALAAAEETADPFSSLKYIRCVACGNRATKVCKECKDRHYCGPECQLIDWKSYGNRCICCEKDWSADEETTEKSE